MTKNYNAQELLADYNKCYDKVLSTLERIKNGYQGEKRHWGTWYSDEVSEFDGKLCYHEYHELDPEEVQEVLDKERKMDELYERMREIQEEIDELEDSRIDKLYELIKTRYPK